MNVRTIGIGIVAVALILAISMTASANPDPVGVNPDVRYNNVSLGTYNIDNTYTDGYALGEGVNTIYINVTTVIVGSPDLTISYTKEDGSTTTVLADLDTDPAAGTWFDVTVVDLVDVTGVVEAVDGTSGAVDIVANVTRQKMHQGIGSTDSAKGGFVTEMNLDAAAVTAKWQGYYGNITGSIVLEDSQGNNMFTWAWLPAQGAEVIATTNTAIPTWSAIAATNADAMTAMETRWEWDAGGSDSPAITFDHESDSVTIAGVEVTTTRGTNSLGGGFAEVVITDGATAAKEDFLFVGIMSDDTEAYDGTAKDFEMLVATPDTGAVEAYYFYVELS